MKMGEPKETHCMLLFVCGDFPWFRLYASMGVPAWQIAGWSLCLLQYTKERKKSLSITRVRLASYVPSYSPDLWNLWAWRKSFFTYVFYSLRKEQVSYIAQLQKTFACYNFDIVTIKANNTTLAIARVGCVHENWPTFLLSRFWKRSSKKKEENKS